MLRTIAIQLANDEAGFVGAAELVLVATIGVLSLCVGLSEVAANINQELEAVGSAFGCINQSYEFSLAHGTKGCATGSGFSDSSDHGDGEWDISCNGGSRSEW